MTFENTMLSDVEEAEGRAKKVITRPNEGRAHQYRFHHTGAVWALSRERDWYTRHALQYAERELDGPVIRRHLPAEQATLDDFDGDRPSDRGRVGVASTAAD